MRVLFIDISPGLATRYMIPMIAHELQHAVELAGSLGVIDRESLLRRYEDIGTPGPFPRAFDTDAARHVEGTAWTELHNTRRSARDHPSCDVADVTLDGASSTSGGPIVESDAEGP